MPFDPIPAEVPLKPSADLPQRKNDLRILEKTVKSLKTVGRARGCWYDYIAGRWMPWRRVRRHCLIGWINVHAGQFPSQGEAGSRIARDILHSYLPVEFPTWGAELSAYDVMRFNDTSRSVGPVIALVQRAINAIKSEDL